MTEQNENKQGYALLEIQRDIERASRHMELEWPEVVDSWEDVASEISMHLLDRRVATQLRNMDPKPRRITLTKIAQQIASRMRDDYEHFNGNYRYSTNEVRRFLDNGALDSVGFEPVPEEDEAVGKAVIEDFDIRVSFSLLPDHHQAILLRRYRLSENLDGPERMQVTRAVDALTDSMNRAYRKAFSEFEGPGNRKVMTNSKAIAKTSYEGGHDEFTPRSGRLS